MPDQFPVFEELLKKRRRTWRWRVCTPEGDVVMQGSESSRPAAKYKADRALFLLRRIAWFQTRKVSAGGNRPHPAVPGPRRQARQNVPDEPVVIDVEIQAPLLHKTI